jgi:hypothetical protein
MTKEQELKSVEFVKSVKPGQWLEVFMDGKSVAIGCVNASYDVNRMLGNVSRGFEVRPYEPDASEVRINQK